MSRVKSAFAALLIGAAIAFATHYLWARSDASTVVIALLLPDDIDLADPYVTAWVDAAAEEGLPLKVVTARAFLRPFRWGSARFAGVILPDTVHRSMSDALLKRIEEYVSDGGQLMLVFDAGTLSATGAYAPVKSRLSPLAGVDYALYDQLREQMILPAQVRGSEATLFKLNIPPGRFSQPVHRRSNSASTTQGPDEGDAEVHLFTYGYDHLQLPHMVTRGGYRGHALLYTDSRALIAGHRAHERGQVMFVNLPLGYLKTRTDGLLLHGFLRFFGVELLRMPRLETAPHGVGGLIMNWHVDSRAGLAALNGLRNTALFEQGPYSIHFTTGPDVDDFGDKLGMDLPTNPEAQTWVRYFRARGDEIGTHGGWIHNYFGTRVNEQNEPEFRKYLEMNKQALEAVTKLPVTEYSAPMGTHPVWVTQWLEANAIYAYYFTGNSGMGPTRTYRNDRRSLQKAWAFPIVALASEASFEEMMFAGVPEERVIEWLGEVTDFVAARRTIRMIYFHPPGILFYPHLISTWLSHSGRLIKEKRFAWYTMTDIATFLTEREQTTWHVRRTGARDYTIEASHPTSLRRQSWRLPASRFGEPAVMRGSATIERDGSDWLVRAGDTPAVAFRCALLN